MREHLSVSVLAILIATNLFRGNVAVRSRAIKSSASEAGTHETVIQVGESLASYAVESNKIESETVQDMTVVQALDVLRKHNRSTTEFMNALQANLGLSSDPRHSFLTRRSQPEGIGDAAAEASGKYNSGAYKALAKLNDMIFEAGEQTDFEVLKCDSYDRSSQAELLEIQEDIAMFNAMTAHASAAMSQAAENKGIFEQQLQDVELEFGKHKKSCHEQDAELNYQLRIVESDLQVMTKVVAMTDCGDKAASGAMLMQCSDPLTNRTWTELRARSPELIHTIAKLQSPEFRRLFGNDGNFLQGGQEPVEQFGAPPPLNTSDESANPEMQRSKCTLSSNPACPKIREKFTNIAGEVFDTKQELKESLNLLTRHCKQTTETIGAQMTNYGLVLAETGEKAADATKDHNTYGGQQRAKETEEIDVKKERNDQLTGCKINIANLASEKCALRKIRGELLKMDALPSTIQDCEVSPWVEEECNAKCGGGKQILTRSLTPPGEHGTKCPAAQAEQGCNEERCPVDCRMGDWSEWGSCTALCGGGLRERGRDILVHPQTKIGEACGEVSWSESCAVQACDVDCSLSEWTDWSAGCSRGCGGGRRTRVKTVITNAEGFGKCPAFYDQTRYEPSDCNTQRCPTTAEPMTCYTKVDVVLLVDGSGSMGADGWRSVVHGSAKLARAMSNDVRMSVLLFSGPTNFDYVGRCVGDVGNQNETGFDTNKDCGMHWRTRFDDNKTSEAVALDIEKMDFPEATTLTSLALSEAATELSHGREDAQSVVIVLTDDGPISKYECARQAKKLKQMARLMWVSVGNQYSDDKMLRMWASDPWEDNVVKVDDFASLTQAKTINEIMLNFCPAVRYGNATLQDLMKPESPPCPQCR